MFQEWLVYDDFRSKYMGYFIEKPNCRDYGIGQERRNCDQDSDSPQPCPYVCLIWLFRVLKDGEINDLSNQWSEGLNSKYQKGSVCQLPNLKEKVCQRNWNRDKFKDNSQSETICIFGRKARYCPDNGEIPKSNYGGEEKTDRQDYKKLNRRKIASWEKPACEEKAKYNTEDKRV